MEGAGPADHELDQREVCLLKNTLIAAVTIAVFAWLADRFSSSAARQRDERDNLSRWEDEGGAVS